MVKVGVFIKAGAVSNLLPRSIDRRYGTSFSQKKNYFNRNPGKKEPPGKIPGGPKFKIDRSLFALAEQLQQHDEHVDEVQIERQRPHDRLFLSRIHGIAFVILRFDALRIISRQTSEK